MFDVVHCFFEQSGIFKNEFKKLGFKSFDYDILDDFNETDFVLDLFEHIDLAYINQSSIFDSITSSDLIFAFFPCTMFENQISLSFRGDNFSCRNYSSIDKLNLVSSLNSKRSRFYELFCRLVSICLTRKIPLVIENPYSSEHFLVRYFPFKPSFIDCDRRLRGDFFKKPTMYYFFNFEPKFNFIFEPSYSPGFCKTVTNVPHFERSLFTSFYANRFIREFIL